VPYDIVKRDDQWCVVSDTKTHGCHDSRADAIKQQRALYRNAPPDEEAAKAAEVMTALADDALSEEQIKASSEAVVTMTRVERRIPVKDVALLRMALQRSEAQSEHQVEQAILTATGLSDPEVAAQTVAVIGHLADRLRTAELNQAALVDVLQAVAADSTASRTALLEALSGISERLAEAPQVNVTVPVPEVSVTVEGGNGSTTEQVVDLERDSSGRLTGATARTVPAPSPERNVELKRDGSGRLIGATVDGRDVELQRDSAGKLVGAVVEKEED
jgi:hypothetical protein